MVMDASLGGGRRVMVRDRQACCPRPSSMGS